MKKVFLFLVAITMTAGLVSAQNREVSGKIEDASTGEGIPFASVQIKGTMTGTSADADGNYSIRLKSDEDVLVFVSVGYRQAEVAAAGKKTVNVKLTVDATALEETIVVAYGTADKKSFTGSVAVVKSQDLDRRKVANVTKALDGLAPGVQATSGSGQPGAGSSIVIRGFGSINASNTPLYVVDGIPYDGAISAINPEDIASISILKDASASALYGARGANGVVLINTKKGSDSGIEVNLRVNLGISSRAIPRYETVGTKDYMEIMYSAFYNKYGSDAVNQMLTGATKIFGDGGMYNPYDIPITELFTPEGKVRDDAKLRWEEDWLSEVTENTAFRQDYGVSVSGGKNSTRYMFSLGYLNEDGVLKTTNFERYSGRVNVETHAKPWFAAGLGANFARSSSNSSQTDAGAASNVFYSAQLMAPIYPIYQRDPSTGKFILDASGNRQFDYGATRPSGQQQNFNSIATLYDDKYSLVSYSFSARSHIDFMGIKGHWTEGLKFQVNFGTDYYNSQSMVYYNPLFGNAASVGGRVQKVNTTSLGLTLNQLLSYNRTFGRHNVDVLVGHEYYAYNTSDLSGHKTGFPGAGIYELDAGAVIVGTGSSSDNDRIESVLSRVGYSYDNRYYISGSWRTDGSSRFAAAKRWGDFWSVGASWRASQESFMRDFTWLDNLTFKFSYGVQGNNNVGSSYYPYQALYDTSITNATLPGATIEAIANPDLTWESNRNLNTGFEASFLNRIELSFDYYNRKTTDMLLSYPIATSTGFSNYYRNSGSMRNSGVEFALTGYIFNKDDLQWSVTWMGSTVKNKVLKLTDDGKDIIGSNQIIREGETLYSYYVARSAGVNPMTGKKMYWATDKEGNDYITESTTVAQANRVIAGSRMPDLYGSLSTAFRWKNIDFSVSTNYSIGGVTNDGVYSEFMSCYYVAEGKHKDILRAWRKPGDVTDVPKYEINETPILTDDKLIDASYFSIKNITLGYTFPKLWTSKIGFKAARLSASVDNLCIFTHLKGMDPQYSLTGGTSYDYAATRTVSFTLDLKF